MGGKGDQFFFGVRQRVLLSRAILFRMGMAFRE